MKMEVVFMLNIVLTFALAIVFWVAFYPLASLPWWVALSANAIALFLAIEKGKEVVKK